LGTVYFKDTLKKAALYTGGELFIRVIWIGATFVFRFCEFNIYWVLRPFVVAIFFFFFFLLANLAEFFVFFLSPLSFCPFPLLPLK